MARCLEPVLGTVEQTFLLEVGTHSLQVERVERTRVAVDLLDVGIDRILPDLVGDDGHRDALGRGIIVAVECRRFGIEDILSAHPSVVGPLGDEVLVLGLGMAAMTLLEGERGGGVEMARIAHLHLGDEGIEEVEVVLQLVAHTEQAERRMIAVVADDALVFVTQEVIDRAVAAQVGGPDGQLHTEIEAHLVGHLEGGIGRTPRMETQMIEPPFPGCLEHLLPTCLVGGRTAREREDAAFERTT